MPVIFFTYENVSRDIPVTVCISSRNLLRYHKLRLLGTCAYYSSDKKYALNKVRHLINKYMVMEFFSSKIRIVSLVLTDYEFVLPCMHFVHLQYSIARPLNARLPLAGF